MIFEDDYEEHKLYSGLVEILCLRVSERDIIESVTDSKVLFLKIQRE